MPNELPENIDDITYDEIKRYDKRKYMVAFRRIPNVDSRKNLYCILNDFRATIDEVEVIISSDFSMNDKKKMMSKEERKIGILFEYISDVIIEYIFPYKKVITSDDKAFLKEAGPFMKSLNKEAEFSQLIESYFTGEIKFYRFFCAYVEKAIKNYDCQLLYYLSFWASGALVFRTDVLLANYLQ